MNLRMLSIPIAAVLAVLAASSAAAEPARPANDAPQAAVNNDRPRAERPEGQRGEHPSDDAARPQRDPSRAQGGGRRWLEHFEKEKAENLAWLRQVGLQRYAERLEEAAKGEKPAERTAVVAAHVRIIQIRRLWTDRPKEAQRAIDEMKLGLEIRDLAEAARKAEGAEKEVLAAKLDEALKRQFEARLAAQRSLLDAMERRLAQLRQEIKDHEELKDEIVKQRHTDLLDPEKPLPEPSLLPPGASDRAGAGERGGLEKAEGPEPGRHPPASAPASPAPGAPTGALAPEERAEMVRIAKDELEQRRVPTDRPGEKVTLDGNEVTVDFPPPPGRPGGSFIVKIDRETKKVLKVTIWR